MFARLDKEEPAAEEVALFLVRELYGVPMHLVAFVGIRLLWHNEALSEQNNDFTLKMLAVIDNNCSLSYYPYYTNCNLHYYIKSK